MAKLLQPEKQQKYCNVVKFELKCWKQLIVQKL